MLVIWRSTGEGSREVRARVCLAFGGHERGCSYRLASALQRARSEVSFSKQWGVWVKVHMTFKSIVVWGRTDLVARRAKVLLRAGKTHLVVALISGLQNYCGRLGKNEHYVHNIVLCSVKRAFYTDGR